MSKRLLIRFSAILAVVALVTVTMLGQQPAVVAAVTLGAFAFGMNTDAWARAGPKGQSPEARRRRAHERSQAFLSQMSMAPNQSGRDSGAQSNRRNRFFQYVSGMIKNSAAGALGQLHSSCNHTYRARDRPVGFRPLIGIHDPAPSVP